MTPKKSGKWNLWKKNQDEWKIYAWTDENDIIKYIRSIQPCGYAPLNVEFGLEQGKQFLKVFEFEKVKTKMSQDELSKGWLI